MIGIVLATWWYYLQEQQPIKKAERTKTVTGQRLSGHFFLPALFFDQVPGSCYPCKWYHHVAKRFYYKLVLRARATVTGNPIKKHKKSQKASGNFNMSLSGHFFLPVLFFDQVSGGFCPCKWYHHVAKTFCYKMVLLARATVTGSPIKKHKKSQKASGNLINKSQKKRKRHCNTDIGRTVVNAVPSCTAKFSLQDGTTYKDTVSGNPINGQKKSKNDRTQKGRKSHNFVRSFFLARSVFWSGSRRLLSL